MSNKEKDEYLDGIYQSFSEGDMWEKKVILEELREHGYNDEADALVEEMQDRPDEVDGEEDY